MVCGCYAHCFPCCTEGTYGNALRIWLACGFEIRQLNGVLSVIGNHNVSRHLSPRFPAGSGGGDSFQLPTGFSQRHNFVPQTRTVRTANKMLVGEELAKAVLAAKDRYSLLSLVSAGGRKRELFAKEMRIARAGEQRWGEKKIE
eukprot:76212-Rhodomonas_salina.3